MTLDVGKARAMTPGCENVIHFNNAGAALPTTGVINAVKDHLDLEARIGGYEAHAAVRTRTEAVYDLAAQLLNATSDEIALMESATRAWDTAFRALDLKAGDKVLTASTEYVSNYLAYLHLAERNGILIEVIACDGDGLIDLDALEAAIDGSVKLIALTHVPTNGGTIQPAAAVGRIARAHGIPYLLDACQSLGQLKLDVEELGCDMLSATGRKFLRAPRGTGLLYVRKGFLDQLTPPAIDLHSATWTGLNTYEWREGARRFEAWECSLAGQLGLGQAIEEALDWTLESIEERVCTLAAYLRAGLDGLNGVTVMDRGLQKCGIVTFAHDSMAVADIKQALADRGVNAWTSLAAGNRLDAVERALPDLVRTSVHYYNTEAECDAFLARLSEILG